MNIEIFTEGSGTTSEKANVQHIKDFFQGAFLPVKTLSSKLSSYGDVSIHILSKEYGYVQDSDSVDELKKSNESFDDAIRDFSGSICRASQTADVIVILLTESIFNETVTGQWDDIISNAKPNSIWCLGASRSAVSSVDIKQLQQKSESVIVYHRVGVARVSAECKDELIEAVRQASVE